jgi:hypothetical protein
VKGAGSIDEFGRGTVGQHAHDNSGPMSTPSPEEDRPCNKTVRRQVVPGVEPIVEPETEYGARARFY